MTTPPQQSDVVASVHHPPMSARAVPCDSRIKNGGSGHDGLLPQASPEATGIHADVHSTFRRRLLLEVTWVAISPPLEVFLCLPVSSPTPSAEPVPEDNRWLFSCWPAFPPSDIHLESQAKQPAVARMSVPLATPM